VKVLVFEHVVSSPTKEMNQQRSILYRINTLHRHVIIMVKYLQIGSFKMIDIEFYTTVT